MKPQHFHLIAAILLFLMGLHAALKELYEVSCILELGAFVSVLHWKSIKSGVSES